MNLARTRLLRWLAPAALLFGVSAHTFAVPTLSLEPESTSVAAGTEFELRVMIGPEPDTISNTQVIVRFDPAIVQLVSAVAGSLYTSSGYQSFFSATEESLGTWEVFEVIFPFDSFVQPPGELLVLRFLALANGFSSVQFLSHAVMDIDRVQISPVDAVGARVFVGGVIVGVDEAESGRPAWGLAPPRPNPTTGGTRIAFSLPPGAASGAGRLAVYDARGRVVRLWDAPTRSGAGEIFWDGRDERGARVAPGVYFFRLDTATGSTGRKVILVD